jgi:hypothetical protein
MSLRLAGALLFLPVPIVLLLFTRLPLGVWPSLALGVALMATHRLYARPFARRHADARCLWCAGAAGGGPVLRVAEPFGETEWRTCGPAHGERVRQVLGWARRHALLLKVGILGGLAVFLLGASLSPLALPRALQPQDWVAFFRVAVATAILPLGWLALRNAPSPAEPLPAPFPVHIQALIGTASVLWLFRVIGIVWLALAVAHVASRLS